MDLLLALAASAVFPVCCLGFVLWMGHIEDTIPTSVARTVRRPDPAPVLRIPVRRPAPTAVRAPGAGLGAGPVGAVVIPAQRGETPELDVPVSPAPVTPAGT